MICTNSLGKDLPEKRVYGRRLGRPLRPAQKEALDNLLPLLEVPKALLAKPGALGPAALFPQSYETYRLEIGFGNGEHLGALLRQYSDIGFLGAEPYVNGMGSFLKSIKDTPRQNIRVLMDDALRLVHALKKACLDKIYVLNPDPWPKKRHHKRRIINRENLDQFARILRPGGRLIMATDVDDLSEWMVTQCMAHPDFEWTARCAKDWKTPPPEWIETRYALKGRNAGRQQTFLIFEKTLANLAK